jgi:molecular chaperone DnaK
VQQGERPLARDNRTLGRFQLAGIPPAPRGVPQVEVTFDLDANGIVNVSARDKATGKEQKITITSSSGLSKEEVDRMMREAESHADDDRRKKDEIELRNQGDQAVYGAEAFLRENGDKLPADSRSGIDHAVATLKGALDRGEAEAITRGLSELTAAQHKAAEAMYRSAAGGTQAEAGGEEPEPGPAGPAKDGVIDAEVVDEGK